MKIDKTTMIKNFKIYIWSVIVTVIGVGVWLAISLENYAKTPFISEGQNSRTILLARGASIKTLAFELKQAGITEQPLLFITLSYFDGSWNKLQTGEFQITPGMLPKQLLETISKGETGMQSFTIVEGWTFRQMVAALNANPYLTHTIAVLTDAEVMKKINHEGEVPEGRFAADTYVFHTGTTDTDVLKAAYQLLEQKLAASWEHRGTRIPYDCPYSALIAASIIEKETAVKKERYIISGVIARRMQQNMHLDMDPTVIYGLKRDFSGNNKLSSSDLRIDTVYNTYLHYGLPPTPISMPNIESIEAALHPAAGRELYYVAKGDGTHIFSETLEEQNKAIKKIKLKIDN